MQFYNRIPINIRILFILLILCLIAFYPIFNAEYISFDDKGCILDNKLITQPLSFVSLFNIFTTFVDNQYTPLSIMSFWLEYNFLLDFNSYFSHFINFILHIIGVVYLYYFSLEIYNDRKTAFVLSSIWAIHPIQAFTVDWIIGRRTILYGIFFIASLFYYTKFINSSKTIYKYLSLLSLILSGLSKTLAFSAPIVWLGIDWLKKRKFNNKIFIEKILAFILSLILVATMFISANNAINNNQEKQIDYNLKESLFSMSYYVIQTLYPHNLSARNELNYNTEKQLNYTYIYFLLFIVIFSIISLKSKIALFGFLFYLFHIFPLSGLIRVGYAFFLSYHYNYIALIGVLFVFIEGIKLLKSYFFKDQVGFKIQIALFIAFLTFLLIKTNKISFIYQTSEKLLLNSIEIDDYNLFARRNLIIEYLSIGNIEKAELYSKKLFVYYPDNYLTYYLNAFVILKRNNIKELGQAIEYFKKANELDPMNSIPNYSFHIGLCYQKLHNWQQAEYFFSKQLTITPNDNNCYLFRAYVRQKLGKYSLADEDFNRLNSINPNNMVNKINWFVNSLQMLNYQKVFFLLLNFYEFIINQPYYREKYFESFVYLFFKTDFNNYLPYYTYLYEIYYKIIVIKI